MVLCPATGNNAATYAEHDKVLFKRKPFSLIPPPPNLSDNAEVFVMRGTGEVFVEYDKYLKRYDYLMQKKFVDAVNGKSGLTYFDALESETKSTTAIENLFPRILRDSILRKVQFSTISRVDDLVNSVYDEFKRNFFPSEEVLVLLDEGGEQMSGVIREKAQFPMIRGPSGEVQRAAFSRYFVRLNHTPNEECLLDDKHIRRDRKTFTKQNIRAFLKHSLRRESWIGAPWLVKEPLAIEFRLPMEIPPHLLQDARLLANKQQLLQMKQQPRKRPKNFSQDDYNRLKHEEFAQVPMQQHPGAPPNQQMQGYHQPIASRVESRPPPPPVIKYPIEDLDIAPKRNGVVRPELAFFTDEMATYIKNGRNTGFEDIEIASMGMLLEVWNTLNVQCEVYILDSFTFDDFVDAMRFRSTDTPCELLEEVHCAVMKLLVDDKGKVTLSKGALPEMIKETEEESSEDPQDESEVSTPLPDAPARSTRSRLSHVDPAIDNPRSPTGASEKMHRATEMLGDRDWITRVGARDFEDGGWQVILVGLLYHLSLSPVFKARCDRILAWLAPIDEEPTRETARERHAAMDINMRISALQMITILSISTPAIKEFLEACSEDMTDVRKRKIDHQKMKKAAMEELQVKDRERKILLPDNMPPESPKQESVEAVSTNGDVDDTVEVSGTISSDQDDDEQPKSGRGLRRGNDRKRKREEEAARAAEEKKKAELAKQQPKQSKEFKKLLVDIEELKKQVLEHEAKITECDADLREANVQRTKVLGKDRFCNRYYWFERNGQPFGGLPRSSTSGYGYANGRIWVQGPDEMERQGFIERTKEEQAEYQRQFNLTVPERRQLEEGTTYLQSANEWGYYDDPVLLDNLIGWLDDRGEREKKLRKELFEWRDTIVQYMEAHKKFKDEEAAKRLEADEESVTRISTRNKTHGDQSAVRERCLRWRNTMVIEDIGHLHSESAKPKSKQKAPVKQQKGVAIPVSRYGKPSTRRAR